MGCIIQTRMRSYRLHGKVMMIIDEKNSVLSYVLNQLSNCKSLDKIVVATTDLPEDNVIVDAAKKIGYDFFRGSAHDVLDRHYQCAKKFSFSTIVRIPSDKPLIDPEVVDNIIEKYHSASYDYASNFMKPSYPSGAEVELLSFNALETVWKKAKLPSEREHVTKYIHSHQNEFSILKIEYTRNLSQFRWALDRMEDLELVKEIVSKIKKRPILMNEILKLLDTEPHLMEINRNVNRNEGNIKSLKDDEEFLKRENKK